MATHSQVVNPTTSAVADDPKSLQETKASQSSAATAPGTKMYKALYDYDATGDCELGFKEGDVSAMS